MILLDTHIRVWGVHGDPHLGELVEHGRPRKGRDPGVRIRDRCHTYTVSAGSLRPPEDMGTSSTHVKIFIKGWTLLSTPSTGRIQFRRQER